MSLMIGEDNFGAAVTRQIDFVDKTYFIKEILDNDFITASVITRPRRFGKTFNMSTLHHFLASVVYGLKTKGMFDNLAIAQYGPKYMDQQGKYPVVFVSFKSVSDGGFEKAYSKMQVLLSQVYREHEYLLSSDKLSSNDKEMFEIILKRESGDSSLLESALLDLCSYLYRHHGVKPWLLIDEYDTPIQSGYFHNYYEEIINLMRGILGNALKGNSYLHRAVITGILRISKESLFSGVNNLKIFSLLNLEYASCFGFTESEVDQALRKANLGHLSKEIKSWYNSYHIGNQQIYNPWSLANCINEKGLLQPYWVNTSSNDLIKTAMATADATVKQDFEVLLMGKPIQALITENMVFGDLDNNSDALWSLLLFSGYLTVLEKNQREGEYTYLLQAPNQEVACLYKNVIRGWFNAPLGRQRYRTFLAYLTEGKHSDFFIVLKSFLQESISYFDAKGKHPEKFYHGFVLGLIVSLSDTHTIKSNKESGAGRYDIMVIPKDRTELGLIIEFKVAQKNTSLEESAREALEQINRLDYEAELRSEGIKSSLKIGLAFKDKDVGMAVQEGERFPLLYTE